MERVEKAQRDGRRKREGTLGLLDILLLHIRMLNLSDLDIVLGGDEEVGAKGLEDVGLVELGGKLA